MKKTVTLLVLISMLFSTVFLFTGCGDSSVKEIKTADDIKGASVGVQNGTTGDTFVSDYEALTAPRLCVTARVPTLS